MVNNKMEVFSV